MTEIETPGIQPAPRRFLMVHGVAHHRPPQHWMWWLTESLRRRGEQVLYPQFPQADNPDPQQWTALLRAELAQLGNGERVVVCHSLGCALWLRASQDLPAELRVDRVLLVSPLGRHAFNDENSNVAFDPGLVDAQRMHAASSNPPRVVVSVTDPYAPTDPLGWSQALKMPCDVLPDAGHVTPADGYGPWPGVLDWCLYDTTPVRANSE